MLGGDGSALPENLDRLRDLRRFGFGPSSGRAEVTAVLDRSEADYDEEWNSNMSERAYSLIAAA